MRNRIILRNGQCFLQPETEGDTEEPIEWLRALGATVEAVEETTFGRLLDMLGGHEGDLIDTTEALFQIPMGGHPLGPYLMAMHRAHGGDPGDKDRARFESVTLSRFFDAGKQDVRIHLCPYGGLYIRATMLRDGDFRKEGDTEWYGILGTSLAELRDLPFELQSATEHPILRDAYFALGHKDDPDHEIDDDEARHRLDQAIRDAGEDPEEVDLWGRLKFDAYDLGHLPVIADPVQMPFTLFELISGVLYELTWYGLPEEAEEKFREIVARKDEVVALIEAGELDETNDNEKE